MSEWFRINRKWAKPISSIVIQAADLSVFYCYYILRLLKNWKQLATHVSGKRNKSGLSPSFCLILLTDLRKTQHENDILVHQITVHNHFSIVWIYLTAFFGLFTHVYVDHDCCAFFHTIINWNASFISFGYEGDKVICHRGMMLSWILVYHV